MKVFENWHFFYHIGFRKFLRGSANLLIWKQEIMPTVSKPFNISKVFLPYMWISENREKLNDFSSPPIRVQYLITCHSLWPMRGQYLVEKIVQRPPPFDIVSTWKNLKKTYHMWKLKNFPFLEIRKILYSWKQENFLVSKC